MSTHGFWKLSATELISGFARRDFSPVEVLDEMLSRIERLNPRLRAYLAINDQDAKAAARAAEAVWLAPGEKPLLCGVPVSVKDTIEMRGMPTTYGSLAFARNMQDDAELVVRLRNAGAVILGKTNTPEFALCGWCTNRLGDPAANPWNIAHSAGGSSGGAAGAVAAGLGPIAIGTDSGGSIRQPAAYNGLFGLKPTLQRIPAVQVWRASPARSHNGPITRTVRDSALLLQAIAGPDSRDPDSIHLHVDYMSFADRPIRGARVALSYTAGPPEAAFAPEIREAVDGAAALLAGLGCQIVPADPPAIEGPEELEPGVWAYSGDHYGAAEAMIPGFWEKHKDDLTDYARPHYEAGQRALAWQYRRILRRNRAFHERMRLWFREYDFLLCPATGAAPTLQSIANGDKQAMAMKCLVPFNHSQNPAAAVPFGFNAHGLPTSIQIVGRIGDDIGVLRMSAAIEMARPWGQSWPEFSAL